MNAWRSIKETNSEVLRTETAPPWAEELSRLLAEARQTIEADRLCKIVTAHDRTMRIVLCAAPATAFARLCANAKALGLPLGKAVAKLSSQRGLLYKSTAVLEANIKEGARLNGVKESVYRRAAARNPAIVLHQPSRGRLHLLECAEAFGVPVEKIVRAAMRDAQIFSYSSESMLRHIQDAARLLRVAEKDYLNAVLKQPSLFGQDAQTIYARVATTARLLGVSEEAFIKAAMRQPTLFYQKPKKIAARVKKSAQLLDMTFAAFIAAGLKQPSLFYLAPKTLASKKPYVEALLAVTGRDADFAAVFAQDPTVLCYGQARLLRCYVVAKLGLCGRKAVALTKIPEARVEAMIVAHFKARIEATGKGARALQVLHARGAVKILPEGIRPLPRAKRPAKTRAKKATAATASRRLAVG